MPNNSAGFSSGSERKWWIIVPQAERDGVSSPGLSPPVFHVRPDLNADVCLIAQSLGNIGTSRNQTPHFRVDGFLDFWWDERDFMLPPCDEGFHIGDHFPFVNIFGDIKDLKPPLPGCKPSPQLWETLFKFSEEPP